MKINHIGEYHKNNLNQWFNIIKKEGNRWVIVFRDYQQEYVIYYHNIINGRVKNFEYPSVYDVGYIGVGKYNSKNSKEIYNKWKNMIRRCYNKEAQQKFPTYKDVIVCEEWKCFQNFAKWYEENCKPWMDNTWHIDKDILSADCKLYSPETCSFIPQEINQLFVKNFFRESGLPKGVYSSGYKFSARININKKLLLLGTFNTFEEAVTAREQAEIEKYGFLKHG